MDKTIIRDFLEAYWSEFRQHCENLGLGVDQAEELMESLKE